ncbi:MAG: hypothetical protein IJL87_01345 [Clostridia bacterium]|nr:hypothetical protein [Clostridia bacterium]
MMLRRSFSCLLAVIIALSCFALCPLGASAVSGLPTNVVIGYWENWVSSDNANLKLSQVNENWDVINVSFLLTSAGNQYTPRFTPDPSLYSSDNAFIADVQSCQAAGKKVLISMGGADGGDVKLTSTSQRDACLSALESCFDKYGFDGIDIDLENSCLSVSSSDTLANPTTPMQIYMEYILRALRARYGDDFMITMAPEHPYVQGAALSWGGYYGGYLPLINNIRDIITFIHPQYYNNPVQGYDGSWGGHNYGFSGYNSNSLIGLSKMLIDGFYTSKNEWFEGLRPDQVAIGVPCTGSAGSGWLPIADYQTAFASLLQDYPTFRGMMTWSINYDASQNNAFANGIRSTIETYGAVQNVSIDSVTANVTGTVRQGTTVTWNVATSDADGTVYYKYDLYRNGALAASQGYSTSSSYTSTLDYGTYQLTVTVKDDNNEEVSATSAEITAEQIIPLSITSVSVPSLSAGNASTITVNTVGGEGGNRYSYYLLRGGTVCAKLAYSPYNTWSVTPAESGSYQLRVYVEDSTGTRVVNASTVTVS